MISITYTIFLKVSVNKFKTFLSSASIVCRKRLSYVVLQKNNVWVNRNWVSCLCSYRQIFQRGIRQRGRLVGAYQTDTMIPTRSPISHFDPATGETSRFRSASSYRTTRQLNLARSTL